mmetsp:Transcript_34176/g.119506  ORF Transcript_34176/g.119506 Transcript_34176/m.119506 type:complete len:961 (+) Transcript_34176:83-2965(+)
MSTARKPPRRAPSESPETLRRELKGNGSDEERKSYVTDEETGSLRDVSLTRDSLTQGDSERACPKCLLALGIISLAGLLGALVVGLVFGMRTEQQFHRQEQEDKCATRRDFISAWAKKQAVSVYGLGRAMAAEERGLPFLVPGNTSYNVFYDTMNYAKALHGGASFATPSVIWAPTVKRHDRGAFEALMTTTNGFPVKVSRINEGDEEDYNPVTAAWSVLDDALSKDPALLASILGINMRNNDRPLWRQASDRVFLQRRAAVFPSHLESGEAIVDDVLLVIIPYCGSAGCADEDAEVLGVSALGLEAELWDSLFPANVEVVTQLTGLKVKSVDKAKFNDRVRAREHQLELSLRCYFKKRGIFNTAVPYLWLGAIGLLIFAVAVVLGHLLENRMQFMRAARRQFGILNTSPDAIVSLTLSRDGAEVTKMEILNPGGDHWLQDATMTLSDVVSPSDIARVWTFLNDPTSRACEFESRFIDAVCGRAIPYEVAVSPVVASKHPYGERICIFRDVLLRVQREEESLCAAKALARAEEHLNHELKTEKYLSHELKNRIIVLVELSLRCAETHSGATPLPGPIRAKLSTLTGVAKELLETTVRKSVLLHLATGVYEPQLEDTDMTQLLETRLERLSEAGRDVVLLPTDGAADADASSLLLDPLLVKIIADNLLSNAIKYGGATEPPSVSMRVDPVEDGVVSMSFEVRNVAGPGHERLLALGDDKLNCIAATEGRRAHGTHGASTSAGDGFPMAVASAVALGGTLRLGTTPTEVVATLSLPRVLLDATEQCAFVDISGLKTALVEDSSLQRKMWARRISSAFPSSAPPILAGESHDSIDAFPRTIISADVDVIFVDQHFGSVHGTKVGTDLVREIRAHDRAAGVPDRLIFVVSANDAPDDLAFYHAAGSSGTLSKSISVQNLHSRICHLASTEPRFEGRVLRGSAPASNVLGSPRQMPRVHLDSDSD